MNLEKVFCLCIVLHLGFSCRAQNSLITDAQFDSATIEYYSRKDYRSIIGLYEKTRSANELNYKLNYNIGMSYYKIGDYSMAEKLFSRSFWQNPGCDTCAYYNAICYMYMDKNYDTAIQLLSNAIAISPNSSFYYRYRGYFYLLSGKYSESKQDLLKAISLSYDQCYIYYDLSKAVYSLKEVSDALIYIDKYIDCDPKDKRGKRLKKTILNGGK